MFFRIKPAGERRYLQIVENSRDGARTVQRVLATLGRVEEFEANGRLDALLRSGARFSETAVLLSSLQAGTLDTSTSVRIGAPMIFGRLWEQTGCRKVIERLAAGRSFGFSLERAVFASVLHRLVVSGSDRACDKWLDGYHIDGAGGLELHQLYRAVAWLGEELADQTSATRAPRRTKDLIVVLGEAGRPICSETWPGNATDVKSLLPVVARLRERLGISRTCVVADRGMISAETIAELEARGIEYILGARERSDTEVSEIVLADSKPMVPLVITRARGAETLLEVKEVVVGDWGPGSKPRRYVVCYNAEEARRDAAVRAAVVDSLRMKLQRGDKQLVGNAGYRRYLATPREGHFEIDAARIAEDARFDGLYVLRTNSKLSTLSIALAYRQLWKVEAIFRTAKSILETRPIYHQSDASIARHLFCSFLALLLRKELDERLAAAGVLAEWGDVVRDLDRVEQITLEQGAKHFVLRPQAPGCAGSVFHAVGVALPPLLRRMPTAPTPPMTTPLAPLRRRGRPRRGATSP